MYQKCMRCGSKNLASLRFGAQVCLDCHWHTDLMTEEDVKRVIEKYDEECEGK